LKIGVQAKRKVWPLYNDEAVLAVFDISMPGSQEFKHAHFTFYEIIAHQANHSLAVLDRPLDALSDDATQWEVT